MALQRRIVLLAPNDAAQRWFQSQALQITNSMVSLRRLMSNQEAEGASQLPVFMLVFLSTIAIFGSFSLFVQPNPTVIAVLTLAALSIAGATFVIAKLNSPFHGLLQAPSTAARAALETLGKIASWSARDDLAGVWTGVGDDRSAEVAMTPKSRIGRACTST